MTLTNVKAMVAKVVAVGFLAGAFLMAGPQKAEAQQVVFAVRAGYPNQGFYHRDHYDHIRREEFRRRDDWARTREYRGYRHEAPYWYR